MSGETSLSRSLARDAILIVVLPCALLALITYVYVAYLTPRPYAGVNLQDGVTYVSSRRFETHGLEKLVMRDGIVDLSPWNKPPASDAPTTSTLVLVHGYNAQEHKVARYFADLITFLRSDAGYAGSIVVFDWPALGIPLDELPPAQRMQLEMLASRGNNATQMGYELSMYSADQRRAESPGAQSLLALIAGLSQNTGRTITIVGHSMGCHLLLHAMKQRPEAFARVSAMVWLAPDVDAGVVREPWFAEAIGRIKRGIAIHYARTDTILARTSKLANFSSRLGAVGPGDPPVASLPGLSFTDMTAELGPANVHGGYLKPRNASARAIAIAVGAGK